MNSSQYIQFADRLINRSSRGEYRLCPEGKTEVLHKMILLTALMGGTAAGVAYLLGDVVPVAATPEVKEAIKEAMSIMDDGRLRTVCIIGSMGGGILSVLLYPLGTPKELAGKIVGSAMAGMMFAPTIIQWIGWQPTTDHVLGISGAVALISWSGLQVAIPLVVNWIRSKLSPAPAPNPRP